MPRTAPRFVLAAVLGLALPLPGMAQNVAEPAFTERPASTVLQARTLAELRRMPGLETLWQRIQERAEKNPDASYDEARHIARLALKEQNRSEWGAWLGLALHIAHRNGRWNAIERDIWPVREDLFTHSPGTGGERNMLMLMDFAGGRRLRGAQDSLGSRYAARIAARAGEGSAEHAQARIRWGESHLLTGDAERGVDLIEGALRAIAMGDDHMWTVHLHKGAAELLWREGLGDAAEDVYLAALETRAARESSIDVARLLFSRSRFLDATGRPDEAIRFAVQANTMGHEHAGEGTQLTVTTADHLAALLSYHGAVASGLNIAERNHDIAWEHLGDIPLSWRTTNNYAEALRSVGRPDMAAPLDEWLLDRRLEHYGPASFQALVSASNAGLNALAMGQRAEAIALFERQREYGEALADPTSEHAAQGTAWIDYTNALFDGLADDAVLKRIEGFVGWRSSPDILAVRSAALAARERVRRGEGEAALSLLSEAERIATATFAPLHPETFAVRLQRAEALAATGDVNAATQAFSVLEEDMLGWMLREVGTAGNRTVARATRTLGDDMLHAFATHALAHEEAVDAFASAAARWTTLTDTESSRIATAAGLMSESGAALARQVVRHRAKRAEMLSSGNIDDSAVRGLAKLADAERALQAHFEAVPDDNAALQAEPQPISAVLAPGDAMVSYISIRRRGTEVASMLVEDADTEARLLAVVRRAGAAPRLYDLGPLADATGMVPGTNAEDGGFMPRVSSALAEASLLAPLADVLTDTKRLFVVPSPTLYALPWPALRDQTGTALAERVEVRVLAREDAIHRIESGARLNDADTALLVGDVAFGPGLDPLPGTGEEVRRIAGSLETGDVSARIMQGDAASEPALRDAVEGHALVHLATHGFFDEAETDTGELDGLWSSGIIFAGASGDEAAVRGDDGIAYAAEVLDWDLSAADLVVLSACQSGLGAADSIDAVRGLPSALRVAGAKRSLLTLWPVNDLGAANFMARFHAVAAEGQGWADALHTVRLEAIRGEIEAANDPSLWGAFVLFEN